MIIHSIPHCSRFQLTIFINRFCRRLGIVVRIHRYGRESRDVKKQMLARHQVISISGTDGKLIKTNGYRLQRGMLHIRTHTVLEPSKLAPTIKLPALRFCT